MWYRDKGYNAVGKDSRKARHFCHFRVKALSYRRLRVTDGCHACVTAVTRVLTGDAARDGSRYGSARDRGVLGHQAARQTLARIPRNWYFGRQMPTPNIFPDEHVKFVRFLYMRVMLMPTEITQKVNAKYKADYSVKQISRLINSRGWSARRKNMVAKLGPIEQKKDSAILREIAQAHTKVMDDVAKGTTAGLERAMQFVAGAENPRTLQAAAAAAKSLLTTYRLAAGLDNSGTQRASSNVYQFNFAATQVEDVRNVTETVPADVSATDLDDDDDHE